MTTTVTNNSGSGSPNNQCFCALQLCQCANVQMYQCANVPMCKCANVPMCQCARWALSPSILNELCTPLQCTKHCCCEPHEGTECIPPLVVHQCALYSVYTVQCTEQCPTSSDVECRLFLALSVNSYPQTHLHSPTFGKPTHGIVPPEHHHHHHSKKRVLYVF